MCMEDVRIGREQGAQARNVEVRGGTTAIIAPPDPKRVALVVSTDSTNSVMIGPSGLTVTSTVGFLILPTQGFQVLRLADWGSLLRQQWLAVPVGADTAVTVADVSLERE